MIRFGCICLLFLMTALGFCDFYLKSGDRVVFYGDSITEQRLYTSYVEAFVLTRYPKLSVDFFPCGIGGDATWGGWTGSSEDRVKRDLKPRKPTVITIMLGMNDGGYVPFDPKIFAVFQEWYGKLLGWMHDAAPNARYTLIGSSPYDDIGHPDTQFKGYNKTVVRFAEYVKELAAERKFRFVDFNRPVQHLVETVLAATPAKAPEVLPDGIHPGPNGHLIMAQQLLQNWDANPVVSSVEIDAATSAVRASENTKVSALKDLAWDQVDGALPFPHDPAYALALENSDFGRSINRQILKVTGLASGTYRLNIDGKAVGDLSADSLANGVNLADLDTPMRRQAAEVLDLTIKRNELYFTQWHKIDFGFAGYPSTHEASIALGKLERDVRKEQIAKAQPKPHHFQLEKKA